MGLGRRGAMGGYRVAVRRRGSLAQIVQFNRKAREGRKGTLHIQRVDPGELEDAIRKISIRQFLLADECWRLFAILAVLAVKFSGLLGRRNEAWTGIVKADTSAFFPVREARR